MKCCGKKESDSSKPGECYAKACRWFLFLIIISAISLTCVVASSCNFLEYSGQGTSTNSTNLPSNQTLNSTETFSFETETFSFGLWRYDPSGEGCRSIPEEFEDKSYRTESAQLGALLALVFAVCGMLIIWIEFICCRFCGGRILEVICFLAATICQGGTFVLFSSELCTSDLSQPYPCALGEGGIISIVAIALYFISAILICSTSKPEPTCVKLREEEKHHDPCCCFHKKTTEFEDANEGDEEQPPQDAEREPPQAVEQVSGGGEDIPPSAVVVAYAAASYEPEEPAYHSSYWPEKKKDEATYATLPPYRDVAFIDGEAFFDGTEDDS